MRSTLLAILVAACVCGAVVGAQRWNATVVVGHGWNNQDMVFDSADNGYLVWGGWNFSRSLDNGLTWSATSYLAQMPGQPGNPDIAIDSTGALYTVVEFKPQGTDLFQLFFRKSVDGGITWSDAVQITNTSKHTAWPKIEVDALDRVHVLWQDKCNLHNWDKPPLPGCTTEEYRHVVSIDHGATWSAAHLILSAAGGGWTLHSAVDSVGAIYGFWSCWPGPGSPGGFYMYKSTDGGITWSGTHLGEAGEVAGAIDGDDTVHVIFARGTGADTRDFIYRSGRRGGATWSEPISVGSGAGQSGYNPAAWCTIAADRASNNVLVAWQDGSSGNFEVYGRRSPNSGKTWQKPENLSRTSSAPSLEPELFFDHTSVAHLVWNEVALNAPWNICYLRGPLRRN